MIKAKNTHKRYCKKCFKTKQHIWFGSQTIDPSTWPHFLTNADVICMMQSNEHEHRIQITHTDHPAAKWCHLKVAIKRPTHRKEENTDIPYQSMTSLTLKLSSKRLVNLISQWLSARLNVALIWCDYIQHFNKGERQTMSRIKSAPRPTSDVEWTQHFKKRVINK